VILFVIAVLTKPQSGLLAPLVLILFFRGFSFRKITHWRTLLFSFTGGICSYIFAVAPFYSATPLYKNAQAASAVSRMAYQAADVFYWMVHLYRQSLDDYPYATANAFNIWTILGGQAVNDGQPFWGLTFATWGFVFLFFTELLCIVLLLKRKNSALALYFSAYLMLFSSFMFASRMHERYLLPSIIFITVCVLWDARLWAPMIVLSLCVLANHWYVYYLAQKNQFWLKNYDAFALVTAVITLAVMIYSLYYAIKLILQKDKTAAIEKGGILKA
jgi:Gpi18-like mannosyltransferase